MAVKLRRHALGLTWVEDTWMARASHALVHDGRVWLVDPYENAEALAAVSELGAPAGVLQLLDRHNRDCEQIARRLRVPLSRLPQASPELPFAPISIVSVRRWSEVGLWWHGGQALIIAEAIGTAPAFALGRRAGVHPMLRAVPPRRQLSEFHPERLFVGHGPAIEAGADGALRDALAHARSDMPKLLLSLPQLLRNALTAPTATRP